MAHWYRELERVPRAPTQEIDSLAAKLTAGRATDLEKLEALYEYVAGNFRYVSLSFGVGRYRPHSAADVVHNQYGDCKDKHTLLASLAESIGLEPATVLINSSGTLDSDFPSPTQFDHVMTVVPLASENVWLDATPEVAPFRMLSREFRNRRALVIYPDGSARVLQTPATTPRPNTATAEIKGVLGESGNLSARVSLSFTGDLELTLRSAFRLAPPALWKTVVEKMSSSVLAGDISDWKVADPGAIRQPFTIEYQVTNATFAPATERAIDVALPMSNWVVIGEEEGSGDAQVMDVGGMSELVYRLRLDLPQRPARVPIPVSIQRRFAEYRADYRLDGRTLVAERSVIVASH